VTFIQPRDLSNGLPKPFFVATEGMGDARLVDEILKHNRIDQYAIGCPSESSSGGTGKDAFPNYFKAIQAARLLRSQTNLRGFLVVADADGDAPKSFRDITAALTNAQLPRPGNPYEVEENAGLRIGIYLLPGHNQTGTLEHLLLKAAFSKSPNLEECLKQFSACTGALRSDKPNALAKMRMAALAAAFCQKKTWCSPNLLWSDPQNPVPIDSAEFGDLVQFLQKFCN
jgi:hypothetical protein